MAPTTAVTGRLLPAVLFLSAFTIVMVLLLTSFDLKVPRRRRHHSNLSDDEILNLAQDDPLLASFIQKFYIHLPFHKVSNSTEFQPPLLAKLVAELFNFKKGGKYVETGAYRHGQSSVTWWLEQELDWCGVLVQPDPADYFWLQRQMRPNSKSLNVCLSPTPYAKEATFRMPVDGNNANKSLFKAVKCFPLYSILLATTSTDVDFLSLSGEGVELQVLKTIPFHLTDIKVMSVEWHDHADNHLLINMMRSCGYKLVQAVQNFYLFQKINSNLQSQESVSGNTNQY